MRAPEAFVEVFMFERANTQLDTDGIRCRNFLQWHRARPSLPRRERKQRSSIVAELGATQLASAPVCARQVLRQILSI